VCHLAALRAAVSRGPRTYSGRRPAARAVGAHRRLFHGRPRTGRAGGAFRLDVRRQAGRASPCARPAAGDSLVRRAGKGEPATGVVVGEITVQALREPFPQWWIFWQSGKGVGAAGLPGPAGRARVPAAPGHYRL
jgi:hypothetical protein